MKKIRTLSEQGVTVITQATTVLSAIHGYIIQEPYTDTNTQLISQDKTITIQLSQTNDGSIAIKVGTLDKQPDVQKDVTKTVMDVLAIVHLFN